MNIVFAEIHTNTSEASPMARHSAQQETEQPLPTPKSPSRLVRFIRSGAFIWVVELLILVAIGIAVYNDWDTPIRDQGYMPISYTVTYDMQNQPHKHYDENARLFCFMTYATLSLIVAMCIAMIRRQRELYACGAQAGWSRGSRQSGTFFMFYVLFMLALITIILGFNVFGHTSAHYVYSSSGTTSYSSNLGELQVRMALMTFSVICLLIVFCIVAWTIEDRNRRKLRERIASLADRQTPMRAEEFLATRDRLLAARMLSEAEFTGVYILHNVTKDMYYVGQSIRVLSRATQHFTGHGNGDVYADFKYGDEFTVSTIPMQGSGYQSLNDLERDTIAAYDAQTKGYNMTQGNMR